MGYLWVPTSLPSIDDQHILCHADEVCSDGLILPFRYYESQYHLGHVIPILLQDDVL